MNEDANNGERRKFHRLLGLVLLTHVGLAALPVAWVKFHPTVAIHPVHPAAGEARQIAWIEPAIVSPEVAEEVVEMPDDAPPAPPRKPPPKVAEPAPARKLAAHPARVLKKPEPSAAKVAAFQAFPEPPAKILPEGTNHAVEQDALAAYHARIQRRIETHWQQPQHLSPETTPAVKVAITIARSGAVSQVELAASSGHAEMDESALEAVREVPQIDPLPTLIQDDTYRLIIRFVLH